MRRISATALVTLAIVWLVLAGPDPGGWAPGALAVLSGALLHAGLAGGGEGRTSVRGVLTFLPFFAIQSIQGGLDVARRAFTPSLPLTPAFLRYPVRLEAEPARILFLNTISLLPGTFSARYEEGEITVHLLTSDASGRDRLRRLEARIAGVFGEDISTPEGRR